MVFSSRVLNDLRGTAPHALRVGLLCLLAAVFALGCDIAPIAPPTATPSLDETLIRPEQNKGLAALFDFSAGLEEQSTSPLRRLVQHRHAATHRFFAVHNEGAPHLSDWTEHVSWPNLVQESLVIAPKRTRRILYLAQMIHIHEKATHAPDSPGSLTLPMPFERTDTDLT